MYGDKATGSLVLCRVDGDSASSTHQLRDTETTMRLDRVACQAVTKLTLKRCFTEFLGFSDSCVRRETFAGDRVCRIVDGAHQSRIGSNIAFACGNSTR